MDAEPGISGQGGRGEHRRSGASTLRTETGSQPPREFGAGFDDAAPSMVRLVLKTASVLSAPTALTASRVVAERGEGCGIVRRLDSDLGRTPVRQVRRSAAQVSEDSEHPNAVAEPVAGSAALQEAEMSNPCAGPQPLQQPDPDKPRQRSDMNTSRRERWRRSITIATSGSASMCSGIKPAARSKSSPTGRAGRG